MIVVEELTKAFRDLRRGEVLAVDHVSFEARPGEIFGLLGPNGAGKTTTMRILCTVLKPTGGRALLAGYDVATQPSQVRQHIGFLSANTALYDRMTAWEVVEYFGKLYSLTDERLRQLQDETGGFTAFICWTFQPEHTALSHIPPLGSFEYLRTQAIARLYLDNIPNIQSSWVTQGLKVGQLALSYGANDMGSLMIEENVVASAGTVHYLTLEQIKGAIREAGYVPRQRNVFYEYLDADPLAIGN